MQREIRKPKQEDKERATMFRVGRSRTGLGLFATRPIKKRETIVEYLGYVIPNEEAEKKITSQYLFEINRKWTIDGSPRWNLARYVNYACKPNAESVDRKGRIFVVATRNIEKDEEITYDYGEEFFDEHIKPKGCKCATCITKQNTKRKKIETKNKKIINKFFSS